MTLSKNAIIDLAAGLNERQCRALFVGGLAVIAHGLVRLTTDIDLVVDLQPAAAKKMCALLDDLGYRPRAPVQLSDFADPAIRQSWITEKDMLVFSCWHPQDIAEIDLFLESPFDFDAAWSEAHWAEVAPGIAAPFVDYERLLNMKRQAGRAKDREDIDLLQQIRTGNPHDDR